LVQFCGVFCGVWGIDKGPDGEMPSDEDRSLRIGFAADGGEIGEGQLAAKHFNLSDDLSL